MMKRRETTEIKKLSSGPGRLCEAFGIDLRMNGKQIGREIRLRPRSEEPAISISRRIGITRAAELEWRFYETGNPFVSKR